MLRVTEPQSSHTHKRTTWEWAINGVKWWQREHIKTRNFLILQSQTVISLSWTAPPCGHLGTATLPSKCAAWLSSEPLFFYRKHKQILVHKIGTQTIQCKTIQSKNIISLIICDHIQNLHWQNYQKYYYLIHIRLHLSNLSFAVWSTIKSLQSVRPTWLCSAKRSSLLSHFIDDDITMATETLWKRPWRKLRLSVKTTFLQMKINFTD